MGSKKRSFGGGGNQKKRADRGGGRYAVAPMRWNCSQTLICLLRRHLPRRGRQSAAAGIGRTGANAPTRFGTSVRFAAKGKRNKKYKRRR